LAPLSTRVPASSLLRMPLPLMFTPTVAVTPGSTRTAVVPPLPLTAVNRPDAPLITL